MGRGAHQFELALDKNIEQDAHRDEQEACDVKHQCGKVAHDGAFDIAFVWVAGVVVHGHLATEGPKLLREGA